MIRTLAKRIGDRFDLAYAIADNEWNWYSTAFGRFTRSPYSANLPRATRAARKAARGKA